jgi:nucleoid-associated protein YgaU
MARGDRYQSTKAFLPSADQPQPFPGLRPRQPGVATGVLEHTWKSTDRLDLLALHYYNDARKWWRILDANPEFLCGVDLSEPGLVGTIILIPQAEEPGGGT